MKDQFVSSVRVVFRHRNSVRTIVAISYSVRTGVRVTELQGQSSS